MNEYDTGPGQIETADKDFGKSSMDQWRYWTAEIETSAKAHAKWKADAKKLVDKYRGKKSNANKNKMNTLWSNVATLQPALFQKMPKPIVERRFKQKDALARVIAIVLQNGLEYMTDVHDAETHVKASRDDYLIVGRGVLKVIYRPEIDEGHMASTEERMAAAMQGVQLPPDRPPSIENQDVFLEHVSWDDFLCSPEGIWRKKRWVAYRSRMDRDELVERFGKKGAMVKLNKGRVAKIDDDAREDDAEHQMFKRADVWEIWDKKKRKVYWLSDGYAHGLLDEQDDPYGLRNFFPTPKPLQVIETSTNDEPVPEYMLYEDQAAEINRLTDRIYKLSDKIRAVGAYAGSQHETLSKMLTKEDGTLVPIENWMATMEGKGVRNMVEWAPIREMVDTLNQLQKSREVAKQDLYEVSGLSDILRGASDAGETATAQRIKGQFATLRLDERKRLLARMISEAISIMGELMAEHFEPHILSAISGVDLPIDAQDKMMKIMKVAQTQGPDAARKMQDDPTWEDVMNVLQSDFRRSYTVRVETEDTIEVDRQADKQQRIEFLTAFVQLLQAMSSVVAGGAMDYSVAKEIIMFSVRGFSQARELEAVLEDMQPPPQKDEGPSDGEIKVMLQKMQAQLELMKQAKDHQFQAAEGQQQRQAQIAQAHIQTASQSVENDKDRELEAAHSIADMNMQREDRAAQQQQQQQQRQESANV
ncbi:hypothetical protein [uncultured Pelagimonas sp.]|uniref:hypothetical protein n=1 Tax=uncultured Pelagimonas sp. TaxID=1618102 RepID=UPI00260727D3|nr:hypothetical protein [uncultured Pelagimonas sp.]